MVASLRKKYIHNGEFQLLPDTNISSIVKKCGVPDAYGVYIIFAGLKIAGLPIYIGRAGTVNQDGSWKHQGLKGRLTAKQQGKPRNIFFREDIIKQNNLDGLSFTWFITHDGGSGTLPCLVEAQLIQHYFNENHTLPRFNKAY